MLSFRKTACIFYHIEFLKSTVFLCFFKFFSQFLKKFFDHNMLCYTRFYDTIKSLMKILRITFCILSCLCVAVCVPIAVFFGLWALVPAGGAVVFGFLMVAAKNNFRREKPLPKTDFMNTDEENKAIREQRKEEKHED